MKRHWQKAMLAAVVAFGVALAGAGHGSAHAKAAASDTVQKKITKLSADAKAVKLKKEGTQQLALTVSYSDKTTEDITKNADWSTADSEIATVEAGLVTATGSGKTKIKASYGGKSVTIPVEIEGISKLAVDQKKLALSVGATKQVVANATYSDKSTAAVTEGAEWATADSEIATVEKGLVTAVGSGKTKITVTYGGKSVSLPVEVDVISKLQLDQKKVYVRPGATQTLKLTASLTNGDKVDVTEKAEWTTSDEKVVTVAGGVVTGVGPGKAKLTVKYGGKSVTVPVEAAVLSKLETDLKKVTLKAGETKALKAFVTYSDKTKEEITEKADWTSVNQAVATVEAGKITAVKAGRTTVIATFNGKLVNVQVTVQ
ncbi:Ig-like domain-containing protein [Brevibacillus choshinensis]|uniref:Ig-like domain-containing protein n=1 Tax=Brevibacillus choshinensis TaxID=54911 RepID=A0ABX7FRV9_BRECH|nr:Ig-like domain-containing protein [Brevibacillus choshinensis]QRG68367.1 Ig-like domain-containing protein [Brevibacillus choshinensis]